MRNIFLSQLTASQDVNMGRRPTQSRSRRSSYGFESHDDAGVAVPGENDQPEELLEAESAISDTDEVLAERADSAIDDAGAEVAIEALRHTMATSLRSAFALEELAEQLEDTIEGDGDGIDETTAQMLTTAIEPAAGGDVIATESFGRNSRMATESMIDTIRDKAKNYYESVSSTISNVLQATSQTVRSIIDLFRNSQKVMAEMKQKISILEEYGGREITNEVQLRQLRFCFSGFSGDAVNSLLTIINKNMPAMVNSANAIFEATSQLATALDGADEKTVSRESKRFFDTVRKFADKAPATTDLLISFPENYEIATLASPQTAKSTIYGEAPEEDRTATMGFKIITIASFEKLESGLDSLNSTMTQLLDITTKKLPRIIQIIKDLAKKGGDAVKSGMRKIGVGKEEPEPDVNDVQLRKAIANVLVAANMICRDVTTACSLTAKTCEKGTLMLVRASLRMAAAEAKNASKQSSDDAVAA